MVFNEDNAGTIIEMLFYISLITFLLLLMYVTGAGALFVASLFELGFLEARIVTMGSGFLVGLFLLLWALLDRKKR